MPEVKEDTMNEPEPQTDEERERILQEEQDFEEKYQATMKLMEQGVPQIQGDPKPFASLMRSDADLRLVFEAIENSIWRSFGEDQRRKPFSTVRPTHDEVRRRFAICEKWFRRARGDMDYSVTQTLDLMGKALRCELDGQVYEPLAPGSRIWTPT